MRIKICIINPHKELTVDGYIFRNPQATIGNNLCKPWCELYEKGKTEGVDFVTFDQIREIGEIYGAIFLDRPSPFDEEANLLMGLPIKKYLVIYECEVISPGNWDKSYQDLFDRIFTWSDLHVDEMRYQKFNFTIDPQPMVQDVDEGRFHARKLLTLMAGAKSSDHPKQLYSHRISAIRWYEQNQPDNFDLYGVGWNRSDYPSYKGRAEDKIDVLDQYKFSICYENATGFPGYITEKILDCFTALNVPVYGGDITIAEKIPKKCFIDIRDFQNFGDLHKYINGMQANEYLDFISSIKNFYSSNQFTQFSTPNFVRRMLNTIAKDHAIDQKNNIITIPELSNGATNGRRLVICVPYGDRKSTRLNSSH